MKCCSILPIRVDVTQQHSDQSPQTFQAHSLFNYISWHSWPGYLEFHEVLITLFAHVQYRAWFHIWIVYGANITSSVRRVLCMLTGQVPVPAAIIFKPLNTRITGGTPSAILIGSKNCYSPKVSAGGTHCGQTLFYNFIKDKKDTAIQLS